MGSRSKKTSSSHTSDVETVTHSFKIIGYTFNKGLGITRYIESGTFTAGGYDWAIRFYPDGLNAVVKDFASIYVALVSKNAKAKATYGVSLVNQTTGLLESVFSETIARVFNSCRDSHIYMRGLSDAIARTKLESKSAGFIVDDCLTIECSITVIKETWVDTVGEYEIEVPPSDLSQHFGELLLSEEGADVTFSVGGETFPAHKIVLATRSPVFKAQLYGQMKERRARRVTVEDMQPDIFKTLLQFIYTDSLPDWNDLYAEEYFSRVRHLLVASDRYAMDRLKLLCASILVEYLDVENVATLLAIADQHNCDSLKDVCIEFMASSNEMENVVKTEGYANLKRTCPSVLVDVLEKATKYRKI